MFSRRALLPLLLAAPAVRARAASGARPLFFCATAGDGACGVAHTLSATLGLDAPRGFATPAEAIAALRDAPGALLLASRPQAAAATHLAEAARLGKLAHVLAVPARFGAQHLYEFCDWLRWQGGPALAVAAACPGAASLARALGAVALAASDADEAWRECGGRAVAAILHPAALAPELLAGRARALATTAPTRLPVLSAIETFRENGMDHLTTTEPLSLHTGAERVEEMEHALATPLARAWPEVAAALRAAGIEPSQPMA